jgi:hypothetical protein
VGSSRRDTGLCLPDDGLMAAVRVFLTVDRSFARIGLARSESNLW